MMKLNIGAGKTKIPGFTSLDAYNPKADIIAPSHETGFEEESVDEIFSSHMIEHLEGRLLFQTLQHWYKILKKGGKVTVLVPNARLYLQEWLDADKAGDKDHIKGWGTRWIVGWEDKGEGMWHRYLFTEETLVSHFQDHNFRIERCEVTETRVKNRNHFEYREKGDIICVAIKD